MRAARPGEHLALPAQRLFEQRRALREIIMVCDRRFFRRSHRLLQVIVSLTQPEQIADDEDHFDKAINIFASEPKA
jgi:hypothetical protein